MEAEAKIVNLLAEPGGCRLRSEIDGNLTESPFDLSGAESGDSKYYAEIILCAARVAAASIITSVVGVDGVVLVDTDTGNFEITGRPEILGSRTADRASDEASKRELLSAAVAEVRRRGFTKHFLLPRALQELRTDTLGEGVTPPSIKP